MKGDIPFNLADFQRDVFIYYLSIRQEYRNLDLLEKRGYVHFGHNPKSGLFRNAFNALMRRTEACFVRGYFRGTLFREREPKADELLRNREVQRFICSRLIKAVSPGSTNEAVERAVVAAVTSLVLDKTLVRNLKLGRDKYLLALVANKVVRDGVETFCMGLKVS